MQHLIFTNTHQHLRTIERFDVPQSLLKRFDCPILTTNHIGKRFWHRVRLRTAALLNLGMPADKQASMQASKEAGKPARGNASSQADLAKGTDAKSSSFQLFALCEQVWFP